MLLGFFFLWGRRKFDILTKERLIGVLAPCLTMQVLAAQEFLGSFIYTKNPFYNTGVFFWESLIFYLFSFSEIELILCADV